MPSHPESTILDLIAARTERAPHAAAIKDSRGTLSFAELSMAANRLAHYLDDLGLVHRGDLVAVCFQRRRELVVAQLALLKLGAAYLPISAEDPAARKALLLRDSGARAILTVADLIVTVPREGVPIVSLDSLAGELSTCPAVAPDRAVTPHDLAYLMYTSGSTGIPKGVAVAHRAISSLVDELDLLGLDATDTVLHLANPSFDASVFEVWVSLARGAAIALYEPRRVDLEELRQVIQTHGVTTVFMTSALTNVVADAEPRLLSTVKTLITGGEAMSVAHARRLLDALPHIWLLNAYGPTETTVFASLHGVPRDLPADAEAVPIGRPLDGVEMYVSGNGEREGELLIGGAGVADGYLHRPSLTAERFVPNPWAADGSRLYRTGDLVTRGADNTFTFAGRLDDQVKVRGFRVEPSEVAAVLRRHPGVADCAVVRQGTGEDAHLIGYVVARDNLPVKGLAEFARKHLPDYMIPSSFTTISALPHTPSGKIDTRKLAGTTAASRPASDPGSFTTPANLGTLVAAEWAEVLGYEVGWSEDFFLVGGNSLMAAKLASRLRARLGIDLPLDVIFENSTIESQAEAITSRERAPSGLSDAEPAAETP
jgi:amino acid adenylation domain-containing protein